MLGNAESELFVFTTESATKNGAQRRATQGEFATRVIKPVSTPARPLCLVKPRNSVRLARLIRRQVDMHDKNVIYLTKRAEPRIEGVSRHDNLFFPRAGVVACAPRN